MKALFKLFLYASAVLAVAAACEKTGKEDLGDVSQAGTTVISADIESLLLGQDTRVWPDGAYIGVFGSESGTNEKYILKRAGAGLASAEFYGPLVSGETLAAYYPWQDVFAGRADAMPVTLTAAQQYSEDDALDIFDRYCPTAFATMKNGAMKFFYPFGMIRIRVELFDNIKVTGITFTSAEKGAAGMGAILPDGSLKMSAGAAKTITLDCGEGVNSITETGFSEFYITLAPGTYETAFMVITAEGEDPIVCALDGINVPRIDAADFKLASVSVKTGGPEGFTVNEQVFD